MTALKGKGVEEGTLDVAFTFEEYEDRLQSKAIQSLPYTAYPPAVISVDHVPREHRTLKSSVPDDVIVDQMPLHIRDCIQIFTQDWKVVNKKTYPEPKEKSKDLELLDQVFEIDIPTYTGGKQTALDPELLQGVPSKVRQSNKAKRTNYDRKPLFRVYPMVDPPLLEPQKMGNPSFSVPTVQLLVRALNFSLHLGDAEPFYMEMFLYDLSTETIITERFHFDCNSELISNMVPLSPREGRDNISRSRQAMFRISNPSSSLYLVIHITKTIRGDPDDTTEMYFKHQTVKPKEKMKFLADTKEAVTRLGGVRQSFAWGALQLFSNAGLPCVPLNQHIKLTNIVRIKGDLASYVSKVNDEKEVKKMKLVPCDCTIEVRQIDGDIPNRLDPSFLPVRPSTGDKVDSVDIIREVQEFDQENIPPQPFSSYVHHLYIYPRTLNFTNYKSDKASSARNLCCEIKFMEDDANVNSPGLPVIYGTSTTSSITRSGWSTVVYHNKKPKWTDEIKVRLPPTLRPLNHLLVTFFHVSCRDSKKKSESLTPLGYCAIRLINANGEIIVDDKYHVPVACVFPPKYFDLENREGNLLRWVDNKKGVFTYKTRLVSTIYTQNPSLNALFNNLSLDPAALFNQISQVSTIPPRVRVQNMSMLITILLRVICNVNKPGFNVKVNAPNVPSPLKLDSSSSQKEEIVRSNPAVEAMVALIDTIQTIHDQTAELEYLESYITYVYSSKSDLRGLHSAIVSVWIFLLDSKHERTKYLAKFSWFFFRLISKSMVLELQETGKLQAENARKGRFSEFMAQLYLLVGMLAVESQKLTSSLALARALNANLAYFLSDILDIGDRGQVFRLIHSYVRKLDHANESVELVELKFSFLRILSFHDFYIPLNTPSPPVVPAVPEIFSVFFKKHFLAGLLVAEVGGCIRAREKDMQVKAIMTLRDQLYRHEHDIRFQDPSVKERIAAIYFPFVPMVLDHWEALQKYAPTDLRDWLICFLYILKGVGLGMQSEWLKKETPKRKLRFFDVLTQCIKSFEYQGREASKQVIIHMRQTSSHYLGPLVLDESFYEGDSMPTNKRSSVTLKAKSAFFKHKNTSKHNTKQILESYYLNTSTGSAEDSPSLSKHIALSSSSNSLLGSQTPPPASSTNLTPPLGSGSGNAGRKRTKSSSNMLNTPPVSPISAITSHLPEDPVLITKQCANLSFEVSMVVLCNLMQYFADHLADLTRSNNDFLDASFVTITTFLRTNQSQSFLTLFFSSLPEIIEDFKLPLFKFTNTLCGELTYELMKHLQDKLAQNRVSAATILFLMIHTNNQTMNNILRMKLQATIAISRLVGDLMGQDFDYTKGCLEAVAKHIKTNYPKVQTQQGSMTQQIEELNERLFGVVRDSIKISLHSYDPEMTAELYSNISRGFMESPDLRVAWLQNLATFHKKHSNWEETAQTLIMTAVLVMEYLKILNRFPVHFPADFQMVFPNIKKELILPDRALLTSLQGEICMSKLFTEAGFINLIKEAIGMQKLGLLYESSVETYRLLLPIHQQKRNWVMQAECHHDLATLCNKIVEDNKVSGRIFSNYYRVALYGQDNLGASHNAEYVYKESNATRLTDLSDRLMKQFGDKFGIDKVHLLPNKVVDVKSLDPTHIYIQIVAVDPFLTSNQLKDRISAFEQNFNINAFIFEIPFTKSGKAHGDMLEQYKRKTILLVEAAFPHVKKRLKVIEKREIEVPPIENAIELIDKKSVQLGQQLRTAQPNSKTLQIILQGSLLMQVNAGPLEICRLFLSNGSFGASEVARLTETMKEFAQSLLAAVKLNAKMVDANDTNQLVLQEELVAGYKSFAAKVNQYIPDITVDVDL
eukprot:Phypoly_transcript_00247.p1 GENE.Phypoly_transcript_00247~~Phypoly_transcript_00247.p1  ORF type:complete len:1883 (+),score=221.77 Phypoly_transcript_00247:138-5651(+)